MAISVTPSKRDAVRVPFGNLIERGLINPGTLLMSENGRHRALMTPQGPTQIDALRSIVRQQLAEMASA